MRYYLQSLARKLLGQDKDFDRLNYCHRQIGYGSPTVDVMYSAEANKARYKNLAVCGSVWLCAVCAARVAEGRRQELELAIRRHHDDGGYVYFSTLTIPHTRDDSLYDFQRNFRRAEERFRQLAFYKRLRASGEVVGTIRVPEVTHWLNGWHYHSHILWFTSREMNVEKELHRPGYAAWASSVKWAGFSKLPDYRHGFYIAATYGAVDDYISKFGRLPDKPAWGPESEMTKGYQKRGRSVPGQKLDHRSPFQILYDWGVHKSPRDAALYVDFARAFRGQQQLRFSPGLRDRLLAGATERTDNELADAALPSERLLGRLFLSQWEKVLKYDQRGEVIDIAARGEWEAVRSFVAGLGVS
jgi:hypothetical protein